jgi:hypothetical protein
LIDILDPKNAVGRDPIDWRLCADTVEKVENRKTSNIAQIHGVKDFAVEQFVTRFAVEAFAIAVLSWTPRFDVGRPGPDGDNPVAKSKRNELRAVEGRLLSSLIHSYRCLQFEMNSLFDGTGNSTIFVL